MTPQHWQRTEDLFNGALLFPQEGRAAFLAPQRPKEPGCKVKFIGCSSVVATPGTV